jgi:hypothetical protein
VIEFQFFNFTRYKVVPAYFCSAMGAILAMLITDALSDFMSIGANAVVVK